MTYRWDTKIRYVKGLGPTRSKELTKIGINTVGNLLEYPPLSYIYPGITNIADASEGVVVVKAKIREIHRQQNGHVIDAILDDGTAVCHAIWYNGFYVSKHLGYGMTAVFYGKMRGGTIQQPRWTTALGGMENVYGGQYGVYHDTIRVALKEVLSNLDIPDLYNGFDRVMAYKGFHFPEQKEIQQMCEFRLKIDEALCLQLALAERRWRREQYTVQPMKWDLDMDTHIHAYFPYARTFEQKRTMFTIARELQRCVPMSRLIHGEVGSGKTAVAFYSAMLTALNGKRTLILCPTTILAQQHYDTLKGMGWDDVYLHGQGGTPPMPHIVIGTHSLLYDPMVLREAHLIIIDEFQKFGVEQRAKIQQYHPHLLLLSATPIPRSLAATVFGDLDVSIIRQLPIKRGHVVTRWVLPEKREGMYSIIERELAAGHQAYVVYPRISGDEDVVSAERGYWQLVDRFGDKYSLSLLTGKNSFDAKAQAIIDFKANKVDILVSTIIAEVGLDNPNATVMVIEGADRFGLSQLHQLRGRVCRSTDTAYCFLVSETSNPTSIARLDVIEKCNCGFEISEHDLRLRGAGEVFSTRQHGLPDLKFVSLVDDYDLMIEARDLVQNGNVGDSVREMVVLKYGDNLQLGEVI